MIRVNFNAYSSYVTDTLYQWDINQTLTVQGLNLSEAPEIHFANANMNRAIVRLSNIENGVVTVSIPNTLLQEPLAINAYIGLYENDTFKIVETVLIPVVPKPRPFDYVFVDSENEIYSFNALNARVTSAENAYNGAVELVNNTMRTVMDETFEAVTLIETGSYIGTGTRGEENPITINFNNVDPVMVIVVPDTASAALGDGALLLRDAGFFKGFGTFYATSGTVLSMSPIYLTWGVKCISWWSTDAAAQQNRSDVTYRYIAFCMKVRDTNANN